MAKRRKRGEKGAGSIMQVGAQSWGLRWIRDGKRVIHSGLSLLEAQAAQDRLRRGEEPFPEDVPEEKPRTIANVLPAFWEWREARGLKSIRDDRNRWKHLQALEPMALGAVDDAVIAGVVKAMQKAKLSPASVGLVLNLLSSFYKFAKLPNPVRDYKVDHKRVLTSKHDPDDTAYLADPGKSKALYDELTKLHPAFGIAYAVSRWAGLRPGEVRALEWTDVDLVKGTIKVRYSVRLGRRDTPKSGANRTVPIGQHLVQLLTAWRTKSPETVLVVPAIPPQGHQVARGNLSPYLNEAQLNTALETALGALQLAPMTFYQVGRHSYASAWAAQGRSIYELSKVMGHSSVTTTERYAHLGGGIRPFDELQTA
jgi:integrase